MELKNLALGAALGVAVSLVGTGAALAQGVPAEQPPASFTGDQYVDSRGCVFVRAGVSGAVEWIPRVSRDRRQICGQTPSTGARTAAAPAARPAASEGVVVIGGAPATTPSRPTVVAPAQAQTRTVAAPTPRVVVTTPAPAATPARPAAPAATGCPGPNAAYFTGAGVRCGPQAVHPGDAARGLQRSGVTLDPVSFAPEALPVPDGFRPAFDDGRLNPLRGLGTPLGAAQMAQIWTDEVPRRLVNPNARLTQGTTSVTVTASSRSVTPRARLVATPEPEAQPARAEAPAIRVPAGHRHVLAATYPDRAAADSAYARLAASGLPARLGQIDRRSGMVYAVVAGPFATPEALVHGLQTTRAAGFSGAVTRR